MSLQDTLAGPKVSSVSMQRQRARRWHLLRRHPHSLAVPGPDRLQASSCQQLKPAQDLLQHLESPSAML
jgi:hypothetical protein